MEAKSVNIGLSPSTKISSSTDSFASAGSKKTFLIDDAPSGRGTMLDHGNSGISAWQSIRLVVNLIHHMLIGFVTFYMSWLCLRVGLTTTALHAWLVTLGFTLLMAEGVMAHYNGNTFLFFYTRKTKTTVHWIVQALGGSLGIAGIIVKISAKNTHFTTTHGKLGLATLILCGLSMISGLGALYSQSLRRLLQPLMNKTFHNCIGVAALAIALVTQFYGYETGFFLRKVEPDFKTMMQVFTLTTLALSCLGPLWSLWSKVSSIARNF